MKFLHTGDIHFEHSKNIYHGSLRLMNTSLIMEDMVARAIEEQVDAFLVAGDVFETGKATHNDVECFVDILRPLSEHKIETVIIAGNHDVKRLPYGHRTPLHRIPDASDLFHVMFDIESLELKNGLKVVGFPWMTKKLLLDLQLSDMMNDSLGKSNAEMTDVFVGEFSDLCEDFNPDVVLGHFTVSDILPEYRGSEVEMSNDPWEHVVPSSLLSDISSKYVGLGHIHKSTQIAENVFYPGSPERFTLKEKNDPKHYHIVDISGSSLQVEQVESKARDVVEICSLTDIEKNVEKLNKATTIVKIVGETHADIFLLEDEIKKFDARLVSIDNLESVSYVENNLHTGEPVVLSPVEGMRKWLGERDNSEQVIEEFSKIVGEING